MKELRKEMLQIDGGEIPIRLCQDVNGWYVIDVDGVEWVRLENQVHAVVLFSMMAEHIMQYMHYEKKCEPGGFHGQSE